MPVHREGQWQESFLGVSAALGESLDLSLAALDQGGMEKAGALVTALRSPLREVRARGIAAAVAAVVVALEEMRLR
jgi:hypothetical protein